MNEIIEVPIGEGAFLVYTDEDGDKLYQPLANLQYDGLWSEGNSPGVNLTLTGIGYREVSD